MTFTESNTFEQMILDTAPKLGCDPRPAHRRHGRALSSLKLNVERR